MVSDKAKVLLVLPADTLDRARVLAGKTTTTLRLPVSLQIVLRGLIEEGLKRGGDPVLLENFERQARAVRDIRRSVRGRGAAGVAPAARQADGPARPAPRQPRRRA